MSEQRRRKRPIMNMETGNEDEQKRENLAPNVPRHFDDYSATSPQDALLEYIKTAIEIETDIATQERIISECQEDMSRRKPMLNLMSIPENPQFINANFETNDWVVLFFGIIFLGFALALLILLVVFVEEFSGVIGGLGALCSFLGIVLGVIFVKYFCEKKHVIKEAKRINAKRYEEYSRQKNVVESSNTRIKADYHMALHEWEESRSVVVETTQPYLDETRALLARHYAKNLIYPKYQNLPALTSIYEYFITGRCERLTGPYGAYNLYEDEIRKDTVISQLNRVVENLEQIRQNQYMLYTKVCTIQQEAAAIRNELAQIKGYTIRIADLAALSAYYARLTERNTRVMMYYHMF